MLRTFYEQLFPWGTRRRYCCNLVVAGLRVIRREGLKSFWQKAVLKFTGLFFPKSNDRYNIWKSNSKINPKKLPLFEPGLSLKDAKILVFPLPSSQPEVSIIIPVFNKLVYTLNCLKSVSENTSGDYEVIIIDDCSTDNTFKVLSEIKHLRLIRNETNSGFIYSCNRGAQTSRGKYLVFLNNDTHVMKDWLSSLVNTAKNNINIGIVGSKIISHKGLLQECGWIIDKDGWGIPVGRGDNPDSYEYSYLKEVDCISGSCFLINKDIFMESGGFDRRYSPAFYEEFDLCFSARKRGYKVVVQPASVIIHYGTASYNEHKRDRLSAEHQEIFARKWKSVLDTGSHSKDYFLARDRSFGKKVILIIDDKLPEYDRHAGGLTMFQYAKLFVDMGYKVLFIPDDLCQSEPYCTEMQQMGIETVYGQFNFNSWLSANSKYLDIVWLSRPDTAIKYLDQIKEKTGARLLYYMHDLHYLREERRYEVEKNPLVLKESRRLRQVEFKIFNNVDIVLTPSRFEKDILSPELTSKKIEVIPAYLYDNLPLPRDIPPFESRKNIVFVGGYNHSPNIDAVLWFVQEIFAEIKKNIPGVKFVIAGSNPVKDIEDLASDDFIVTGYVKDLDRLLSETRVFVSPLRYGAGVKGKIVTSMSQGLPVVTTETGSEGLGLRDGEEVLIASTPDEFAQKVVKLYKDRVLWEKLSASSIKYVENNFSVHSAKNKIQEILG